MTIDLHPISEIIRTWKESLEDKGYSVGFSFNPYGEYIDIYFSLVFSDGRARQWSVTFFSGGEKEHMDETIRKIPTARSLKTKYTKEKNRYAKEHPTEHLR